MTRLQDLDECTYGALRGVKTLAVGWLDTAPESSPLVFERAIASPELIDKLVLVTSDNLELGWRAGGYHKCNLPGCQQLRRQVVIRGLALGSWLTYVRHPRDRRAVFCAPNLVLHYVAEHHYRPPRDFVDAVLSYRRGELPIKLDRKHGWTFRELSDHSDPAWEELARTIYRCEELDLRDLCCPCGGPLRVSFTRTTKRPDSNRGAYSMITCLRCNYWRHAAHVWSYAPPWATGVGPMSTKEIVTRAEGDPGGT